MSQQELMLGFDLLTEEEIVSILRITNKEWKGMVRRAHYQDMAVAIGTGLRAVDMDRDDKLKFAVAVSRSLHSGRTTTQFMTLDIITRITDINLDPSTIRQLCY